MTDIKRADINMKVSKKQHYETDGSKMKSINLPQYFCNPDAYPLSCAVSVTMEGQGREE